MPSLSVYPFKSSVTEWADKQGNEPWEEVKKEGGSEQPPSGSPEETKGVEISPSAAGKACDINLKHVFSAGQTITGATLYVFGKSAATSGLEVSVEAVHGGGSGELQTAKNAKANTAEWLKIVLGTKNLEKLKGALEESVGLTVALIAQKKEKLTEGFSVVLVVEYEESAGTVELPLVAAAASSTSSAGVDAVTKLPVTEAIAVTTDQLAANAETHLPLGAASGSTTASLAANAETRLTLNALASSASSLTANAETRLLLTTASAVTTDQLAVVASTRLPFATATGTTTDTLMVRAPTQLPLGAASTSSATFLSLTVGSPAPLPTGQIAITNRPQAQIAITNRPQARIKVRSD